MFSTSPVRRREPRPAGSGLFVAGCASRVFAAASLKRTRARTTVVLCCQSRPPPTDMTTRAAEQASEERTMYRPQWRARRGCIRMRSIAWTRLTGGHPRWGVCSRDRRDGLPIGLCGAFNAGARAGRPIHWQHSVMRLGPGGMQHVRFGQTVRTTITGASGNNPVQCKKGPAA